VITVNWRGLAQPSLVRRIGAALLSSFVLVLLAFLARNYWQVQRDFDENLAIKVRAEAMAPVLARLSDEREAGLVLASLAEMLNARRGQHGFAAPVFHQLRRADGQLVAAFPAGRAPDLAGRSGHILTAEVNGQPHHVVQADAGPWRVLIAAPAFGDRDVLQWLGQDILNDLMIALPLVLLPLWLALRSGLKPLRELAAQVAARHPQDLSPLGLAPPHAELKPLVAAFEQLLAQLRHKVQLERAFVQDAAHELRTPMAAIGTQAHVLARTDDPAERRRAEAALELMLQRAAHLNEQLLALAVLDDGHAPARAPHDIAALLQTALALAAPRATASGLELSLDAPERCEQLLDLGAFQSVLHNLLDNALRYVPRGGRIDVRLALTDTGWRLTVADDGPGLAPALRERAFDRFWRGAAVDTPGSGLGLAIVRQAAARLGGAVRIEDGLGGRGVAFVLEVAIRAGAGPAVGTGSG
jgi:two-component system sensor histidine kinase QseC